MRSPRTRHRWIGTAALLLFGCDEHVGCEPVLRGEAQQLEFDDQTLVVGAADRMHDARALVEGSRFCPQLACVEDVPGCTIDDDGTRLSEQDVRACYESTIAGPVTQEGNCVVADAPGELDWTLALRDCDARARGYEPAPERLRLPIVDAAALQPWLQSTGDGFAVRELVAKDGGELPIEPQLVAGETAYVLADATVHFSVVLAHPMSDQPVAWNPPAWSVSGVDDDGGDVPVAFDAWGVVALALPAGTAVELTLHRDAVELPIGRVEAVDADDIASLEVVAGFLPDDEAPDGHRMPIGARAIARTADDRVVYGLPVEWSVTEGALPLWRDDELQWDPDFTALEDRDGRGCHEPPEERTIYEAEVVATWRTLEASAELEWTEEKVDEGFLEMVAEWFKGEDWDAAETCEGPGFPEPGCGCSTDNRGGLPLVALALLVATRRRRQSAAPS